MIKFETHLHNRENSECATAPAKEIPALYRAAGYGGIVVTNHYNIFAFEFLSGGDRRLSWRALMDKYLYGYRTMKEIGEKIGLKVFLGAELSPSRFISPWGGDYPGMEFLVYGPDEDFFYNNPNLHLLSQEELFEKIDSSGFVMYQAHPFRPYCTVGNPAFMHGAEVFNLTNERFDTSANAHAADFADKHKLLKIAGTDFHHTAAVREGLSGITVPDGVSTVRELAECLKSSKHGSLD